MFIKLWWKFRKKFKSITLSVDNQPIKYTPEEALALYIGGGYTRKVYMDLQNGTKKRNANIFRSFEVPLQSLIDHAVFE